MACRAKYIDNDRKNSLDQRNLDNTSGAIATRHSQSFWSNEKQRQNLKEKQISACYLIILQILVLIVNNPTCHEVNAWE